MKPLTEQHLATFRRHMVEIVDIAGLIRVLWWLNLWYCQVVHRLRSTGPAPLPERGAAILIANQVTQEGESTWFEGLQLLAVYLVLALVFFFV